MPRLVVTDDQAWLAGLGVLPETSEVPDDEYVRELRFPVADGEEVQVTWDVTDSSVRVRHRRDGSIVSDLFRETATLLTVTGRGSTAEIIVEYGSDGWSGRTRIRVLPAVVIEDTLLRS